MSYFGKNAVQSWVEFNGSTDSVRASHNISSISDTGVSEYDINFSTNFADADYVVFGSTVGNNAGGYHSYICSNGSTKSASAAPVRFRHAEQHNNAGEMPYIGIAFVGNQ